MVRLDKYLADMGIGTRSEVKQYLKKGFVTVNSQIIKKPEIKIDIQKDAVSFRGRNVVYKEYEYFMFYKPAGCITATKDKKQQTVLDYFKAEKRKDLFPVGRLDKDTEGLLLLTNDGILAHELLSPVKHIEKTYFAKVIGRMKAEYIPLFEEGLDIGDDTLTAPARLEILYEGEKSEILLTITEGRFHQVKRMVEKVGCKVEYLKRLSMGSLTLDAALLPGEYRTLTEEEVNVLKGRENNAAK